MTLSPFRTWLESLSPWEKTALAAWSTILVFVSGRVFITPEYKTVYPIFSASGRFWWNSTELYEPHRPKDGHDGYRYSPTFAILITPFAICPDRVGGVMWRLVNALALLGSLTWFARAVLPGSLSPKHFAWLSLLIVPLSLQSINNGQANLLVIAAMLGTVAALNEERWNLASVLLALAFIIKVYPLALGMVLILLYPRQLLWRMPLAMIASLLVPFLGQHPDYVIDQYAKWITLVRSEDRANIPLTHMYRDLWLLIHLYGIPISRTVYLFIQVAAGAGVALICWRRQRTGWPARELLTSTLALVTAWMMLLGPATESSSFVLLAPSFAWSVLEVLRTPVGQSRRFLLWGSVVCFAVAVLTGGFSRTVGVHGMGVHSWASLLYFAYLLAERRPLAVPVTLALPEKRLAA